MYDITNALNDVPLQTRVPYLSFEKKTARAMTLLYIYILFSPYLDPPLVVYYRNMGTT